MAPLVPTNPEQTSSFCSFYLTRVKQFDTTTSADFNIFSHRRGSFNAMVHHPEETVVRREDPSHSQDRIWSLQKGHILDCVHFGFGVTTLALRCGVVAQAPHLSLSSKEGSRGLNCPLPSDHSFTLRLFPQSKEPANFHFSQSEVSQNIPRRSNK